MPRARRVRADADAGRRRAERQGAHQGLGGVPRRGRGEPHPRRHPRRRRLGRREARPHRRAVLPQRPIGARPGGGARAHRGLQVGAGRRRRSAILAPNRTDFMLRVRSRRCSRCNCRRRRCTTSCSETICSPCRPPRCSRAARWWRRPTGSCCRARACRACTSADGELMTEIREEALQSNGTDIFVQLDSDGFNPLIGLDTVESVRLIDARQGGGHRLERDRAHPAHVPAPARGDGTGRRRQGSVPAFPLHNILAPETLRITLPATLPLSGQAVTIEQGIRIAATPGSADVMGTLTALTNNIGTTRRTAASCCCGREPAGLVRRARVRAHAHPQAVRRRMGAGDRAGGTAFRAPCRARLRRRRGRRLERDRPAGDPPALPRDQRRSDHAAMATR